MPPLVRHMPENKLPVMAASPTGTMSGLYPSGLSDGRAPSNRPVTPRSTPLPTPGALCCVICNWAVGLSLRDTDTAEDKARKKLFIPTSIVACVFFLPTGLLQVLAGADNVVEVANLVLLVLWTFVLIEALVCGYLPLWVVTYLVMFIGLVLILVDWMNGSQLGNTAWPALFLIIDLLLVINAPNWTTVAVITMGIVGITCERMEYSFRYGLYDWMYFDGENPLPDVCTCARPPCPRGTGALAGLMFNITVFCNDYYYTRGFRDQMNDHASHIAAAVSVSEQAAVHLARYEVDEVQELLDGPNGERLPSALHEAYVELMANLREYKKFLPQNVLCRGADSGAISLPSLDLTESSSGASNYSGSSDPCTPVHDPKHSRARTLSTHGSQTSESPKGQERRSLRGGSHTSRLKAHPQIKNLTLLSCNRRGFLDVLSRIAVSDMAHFLAGAIARFAAEVARPGGCVGSVSADHLSATFGGARPCPQHRLASVQSAHQVTGQPDGELRTLSSQSLVALPATSACCSGTGLCGDFGSMSLQQWMVLGGLCNLIVVSERLASSFGVSSLVDEHIYGTISERWTCKVLGHVRFPKRGSKNLLRIWQALGATEELNLASSCSADPSSHQSLWDEYNNAARLWIDGDGAEAEKVARAAEDAAEAAGRVEQQTELGLLRRGISASSRMPALLLEEFTASPWDVNSGERGNTEPLSPANRTDSRSQFTPAGMVADHAFAESKLGALREEDKDKQMASITSAIQDRKRRAMRRGSHLSATSTNC